MRRPSDAFTTASRREEDEPCDACYDNRTLLRRSADRSSWAACCPEARDLSSLHRRGFLLFEHPRIRARSCSRYTLHVGTILLIKSGACETQDPLQLLEENHEGRAPLLCWTLGANNAYLISCSSIPITPLAKDATEQRPVSPREP